MRVLSLDVGDRRIGAALSDPLGIAARPLPAIVRAEVQDELSAVLELAAEHEVSRIAVGLPITLGGKIGHQASKVRAFMRKLAARTDLPIIPLDERYSSSEAERLLRASGRPARGRDRGAVDSTAAAVILQGYLDANAAR